MGTLYIRKASPWENGYVEPFNGRLRGELLNGELFLSLAEARLRAGRILGALKPYGAAAKELLPDLRDLVTFCRNEKNFPENCKKKTAAVEDAVKAVEAATDLPELRSIAPLLRNANRGK